MGVENMVTFSKVKSDAFCNVTVSTLNALVIMYNCESEAE